MSSVLLCPSSSSIHSYSFVLIPYFSFLSVLRFSSLFIAASSFFSSFASSFLISVFCFFFFFLLFFQSKVIVAGREWRDRWEDGEDGVFRAEDTSKVKVAKVAELGDSDLQDAKMIASLFSHTANKVLGDISSMNLQSSSATSSRVPAALDLNVVENREAVDELSALMGQGGSAPAPTKPKPGGKNAQPPKRVSEGGGRPAKQARTSQIQELPGKQPGAACAAGPPPAAPQAQSDCFDDDFCEQDAKLLSDALATMKHLLNTKALSIMPGEGVSADQATKKTAQNIIIKFNDHTKNLRKDIRRIRRRANEAERNALIERIQHIIDTSEKTVSFFKCLMLSVISPELS